MQEVTVMPLGSVYSLAPSPERCYISIRGIPRQRARSSAGEQARPQETIVALNVRISRFQSKLPSEVTPEALEYVICRCLRLYHMTLAAEMGGDQPFVLTDTEMITRAGSYFAWSPAHHTAGTNVRLAESLEAAQGNKSMGRGDMDVAPRTVTPRRH